METNTSQNSVATYEGVVGPFITTLLQIYTDLQMEEFWIDRNMPMSLMCSFFGQPCTYDGYGHLLFIDV